MNNIQTSEICRVVLSGNFDNDSKIVYCFPSAALRQVPTPAWKASVPSDPRPVRDRLKSESGYALWANDSGYYYSYVFRNKKDFRGGYAIITLQLARGYKLKGADVLAVLRQLYVLLVEQDSRTDMQVEALLRQWALPRLKQVNTAFKMNPSGGEAYCLFQSEAGLVERFSYIDQDAYRDYRIVWLVQNQPSALAADTAAFKCIKSPVVRKLTMVKPEGVNVSILARPGANYCCPGDSIKVTYKKPGFEDVAKSCRVENNALMTLTDEEVVFKSAKDAGVSFSKTLRVRVMKNQDNIRSAEVAKVIVVAKVRTQAGESAKQMAYNASTACFETKLTEDEIMSLIPDKPIMVSAKMGEAGTNIEVQANQIGLQYMNAPRLVLRVSPPVRHSHSTDDGRKGPYGPENIPEQKPKWWHYALQGVVCIFALIGLFTTCKAAYGWIVDKPETKANKTVTEIPVPDGNAENPETDDDNQAAAGTSNKPQAALEADDLKYLGKNNEWNPSEIKSEKYKQLVDDAKQGRWMSFADGANSNIPNNLYQSVANKIRSFYGQQRSNQVADALSDDVSQGIINLVSISNSLTELQNRINNQMGANKPHTPPATPTGKKTQGTMKTQNASTSSTGSHVTQTGNHKSSAEADNKSGQSARSGSAGATPQKK